MQPTSGPLERQPIPMGASASTKPKKVARIKQPAIALSKAEIVRQRSLSKQRKLLRRSAAAEPRR
jgi:hypothetical protein